MNPFTAGAAAAPSPIEGSLPLEDLEAVYDRLATAIDSAAGQGKAELFLTKLALLNAHAIGSAAVFDQHLRVALADL